MRYLIILTFFACSHSYASKDCPKFCTPTGQYAEQILNDLNIERPSRNPRTGESKQKSPGYLAEKYNKYCSPKNKFIPGNAYGCRADCSSENSRLTRFFKKDIAKSLNAHLGNLLESCKTLREHLLTQGYEENLNLDLSYNRHNTTEPKRPPQRQLAGTHRAQGQSQEPKLQRSSKNDCTNIQHLENDLKQARIQLNMRLSGLGNPDEIEEIMSLIDAKKIQINNLREKCNLN